MNSTLTHRQRLVFEKIYNAARDRGYQPTIRELMHELRIKSPNGIVCHIDGLVRKGFIKRQTRARSMEILRTPQGTPFVGFRD